MASPPTGTVTFLFTDIEGSTKLWERSPQAMQAALARHDELLRRSIDFSPGKSVAARISMFDVLLADQLAGVTNLESAFVGDRENAKLPNVRFFFNRRSESRKIDVPLRRGEVLIAIQTWARNFDRKMSEGQYRVTQRRWEAAKRKLAHSWQESSTGYSQSCKSHSKTVLTSHRGV